MHFSCRSFLGHLSPADWSQFWENEPDSPALVATLGHLFGLIHLPAHDRPLIDQITAAYFSSPADSQTALTAALRLSPDADLVLAAVINNRLFLAANGAVAAILRRSDQISQLTADSNIISGLLQDNDQLLLITQPLLDRLGLAKINEILSLPTLQNIEENFLSAVYSLEDQTALAAALIQIHFDETDNQALTPPPTLPAEALAAAGSPPPHSSFFQKLFSRPLRLSHFQSRELGRRRRLRIIFALLLLLGLGASSFFGYRRQQQRQLETRYQQLLSELKNKITASQAVKNLNLDESLSTARQAREILNQLITLKTHQNDLNPYRDQVASLLSQTGSAESLPLQPFYDTSLIIDSPKFSQIFISRQKLYLLDPPNGRIDLVDLSTKSTQKIAVSDTLKDSLAFAQNQKDLYVSKADGIYLVGANNLTQVIAFLRPTDFAFWNGSLYLLDSASRTILKSAPNVSGFSPPIDWLKSKQNFPANPVSLSINGRVWVLAADGQIFSYLRGSPDAFKTASVYRATRANHLTTTLDDRYLAYVADDSFIYVYQKTGEIHGKYNLGDKKVLDLALDPASPVLYLLCSDQKIYQISL